MKTTALLFLCALVLLAVPATAQYGQNRTLDVPYVAPGVLKMDPKIDSAAWIGAPKIDLTANWDGAWSGHPTADVVASAKLLWTTDTLYVYAIVEDFEPFYWGPPGVYGPWKGDQLLVAVDGTHARDSLTNGDWGGWPENAPDKGPVCYKISDASGISLNWGGGGSPVDSGWTRGKIFVDTVNFVWGVEMAIYVPQIGLGTQIGFNAGGANATVDKWKADWDSTDHAYGWYSWLSAGAPGGDVMHVAKSFGSLNFVNTAIYGQGIGMDVPYVAPGVLKMDPKIDSVAWLSAPKIDLTANWDGAWSGHPTADVVASAKLLWTTDTLYVYAWVEDFEPFYWGPPGVYGPWKGDQLLIGVDGTHARDSLTNGDWGGWPENAPDKGPVCYKISDASGISLNWGGGGSPVDSGWTRGKIFVDTVNFVWGVEMAIYVPQIGSGTRIGFNAGGANATVDKWKADWDSTDHAYGWYSWLSAGAPGGDVMHVAKSFGTLTFVTTTGVGEEPGLKTLPNQITLNQNYPNPFNPATMISYSLPHAGKVAISVYNLLGQEVARLVQEQQAPGEHSVRWNAGTLGSGVYFYQLRVDDRSIATKKMLLVK